MSLLQPTLVIGAVVAALLGISWLMLKRREHVWEGFAREHGLNFATIADYPEVRGQFHGREIVLQCARRSSDKDEFGAEEIKLCASIRGKLPAGLMVTAAPLGETAATHLATSTITTGDDAFDPKVHVIAHDAAAVKRYLTPERRAAILKLFELGDPGQSSLEQNRACIVEREIFTSRSHLEARLAALEQVMPVLDAAG